MKYQRREGLKRHIGDAACQKDHQGSTQGHKASHTTTIVVTDLLGNWVMCVFAISDFSLDLFGFQSIIITKASSFSPSSLLTPSIPSPSPPLPMHSSPQPSSPHHCLKMQWPQYDFTVTIIWRIGLTNVSFQFFWTSPRNGGGGLHHTTPFISKSIKSTIQPPVNHKSNTN